VSARLPMTTKDSFSIAIALRHPSYSPESISKFLSIPPFASHTSGYAFVGSRKRWTHFYATLQKGNSPTAYENALSDVVLFLEKHSTFWPDFMSGQGEVELILNHTLLGEAEHGDLCLELHLQPVFLHNLAARGIGLRVQGWSP
jgi:hypothetical protein